MGYRCLLFDLDGTLLRGDKSISPRTLRALEENLFMGHGRQMN
jgi:hydroxymethylpyrimidine pyrophosphatase-like HAD family hydrolase